MSMFTAAQIPVLDALAYRKFQTNRVDTFEGDEGPTVYLSKRISRFQTVYAEVDDKGLVNGQPYDDFLKTL